MQVPGPFAAGLRSQGVRGVTMTPGTQVSGEQHCPVDTHAPPSSSQGCVVHTPPVPVVFGQ